MSIGNSRLILQPRDKVLLRLLSDRRLLDRDQVLTGAGFRSVSRVNARLGRLKDAGLIVRYFTASRTGSRKSVYTLSATGRSELGSNTTPFKWKPDNVIIGNAFAAHQLATNDVYFSVMTEDNPAGLTWKTVSEPISSSVPLIPDGLIEENSEQGGRAMFLEVDLGTESLPTWTKKVQLYLKLAIHREHLKICASETFSVLVVTDSKERSRSLRIQTSRQTSKLFWFTTLENIKKVGFWSPTWLRPSGSQHVLPGA